MAFMVVQKLLVSPDCVKIQNLKRQTALLIHLKIEKAKIKYTLLLHENRLHENRLHENR